MDDDVTCQLHLPGVNLSKSMAAKKVGTVFLVGAGPGDPGLITLRGIECLKQAEAILYDYLVNPRILEHASPNAERHCVGQHGQSRIWSQEEINQRMVSLALDGKMVVRLKGGDPGIFGREVEEIAALVTAEVPCAIVPGITAASAAASYAGIPLTHREFASAVALVTAQESGQKATASLDYRALAIFPGTLVFYMGVTTARHWSQQLIGAGKDAQTPVAIVRRCSMADQTIIRCTLGELGACIDGPPKIRPPAICIVGEVAGLQHDPSWFERRPLFGKRILVSRPRHQAGKLAEMLEVRGAEVWLQPAIEIRPPKDWTRVDETISQLGDFDWIVFSSTNGVSFFIDRLLSQGLDARALGKAKIAAIGPGTSERLAEFHLHTDLEPTEYRAESLADSLTGDATGKRFLLIRASRGRDVLAATLSQAGGIVDQAVVYESVDVVTPDSHVANLLADGKFDWVTVTSSAIARALVTMFGDLLRRTNLVSISPLTSATLRELGHSPAAEAEQYTMEGVVQAILREVN